MLEWTTGRCQTSSTNCLVLQIPQVYPEHEKLPAVSVHQHIHKIDTFTTPGQFKTAREEI